MESNYRKLGEFIRQVDIRNKDLKVSRLLGVSISKSFIESIANTVGTDFSNYKVVHKGQFAYGPVTSRNGEKISVALLEEDECIISSSYMVFEIVTVEKLLPEYLMLWFRRSEFDRYARYKSHGSVREIFDWNELCDIELPVPDISEQRKIVEAYKIVEDRIELKRRINDNLTEQCSVDYNLMLNGYTTESEELPDGWSKGSIGSYCDVKSGFAFKSDWWTTDGYKVIKIANIVNNTIDLDSCDCVIAEHAKKANNFYVQSGDILIAMTGATTGKIGIVPLCDELIVVNQRVGKFFLGDKPIEKVPFLYSTLLYSKVVCHLQPDGTAGSAQDNLSADNIKDVAIVLPEQIVIDTFNQQHIPHIKTIMSNCAEIRVLNKLAETVLQTLLSR
ncbi:MAG: restriction endonuclease subunit S [Lachnospiraceae bacterium]|nr:restriction endonuclease subunit S [Lachnospiraceae bacterium]